MAERLRSRTGQETVRGELLIRAGWGFSAQGRLEGAEGAFKEAVSIWNVLADGAGKNPFKIGLGTLGFV